MSTFGAHAAEAMERRDAEFDHPADMVDTMAAMVEAEAEARQRRRIVSRLAAELQLDPLGGVRRTAWNRAIKRAIAVVRAA